MRQWIAHLKNIEHLRTGIGLVGYATRNPKNEYKIRGFNLFREMWEGIEQTVLDKVINMRLTEEQRRQAEEGAEYETALTRANERRSGGRRASRRQRGPSSTSCSRRPVGPCSSCKAAVEKQRRPPRQPSRPRGARSRRSRPNDPCPCGSGKRYKKCHGKRKTA